MKLTCTVCVAFVVLHCSLQYSPNIIVLYVGFPATVLSQLTTGPMLDVLAPEDKKGYLQGLNSSVMNFAIGTFPCVARRICFLHVTIYGLNLYVLLLQPLLLGFSESSLMRQGQTLPFGCKYDAPLFGHNASPLFGHEVLQFSFLLLHLLSPQWYRH